MVRHHARQGGKVTLDTQSDASGPTHAGVSCSEPGAAKRSTCSSEATNRSRQWVLPKGHLEEGESHRETAVREVT